MRSRSSIATVPVAIRSSSSTVKEVSRKKSIGSHSNRHDQLAVPDESWEANRLGEFASAEQKRLRLYDRKMAIHAFRLGHALSLAHEKVPYGDWGKFLKKFHVSEATDWRARKLYDEAKTENALKSLGIADAYKKFGINRSEKKQKPTGDEQVPPPKESKSLSMTLSQIGAVFDHLIDEAAFTDWQRESKRQCLDLVQDNMAKLTKIGEAIGHE